MHIDHKEEMLSEVQSLRVQGRHLRDIGMPLLSHAAYRSARGALRSFRLQDPGCIALCYCNTCRVRRAKIAGLSRST